MYLGGEGLQLLVSGALSIPDQGGPGGILQNMMRKPVVETLVKDGLGGAVEGIEHPLPLLGAEDGQLADGTVRGGEGLPQDVDQAVVESFDLLGGEKLGEVIVIHREAAVILQVAQMDAKLLQLITAVVPAAGEGNGGVPAFHEMTVLIGEGDVEQPVRLLVFPKGLDMGKGEALMAQHIEPLGVQPVAELVQGPVTGDLAEKGQGADEHAACLLGGKILAVKNGNADGKAVRAADAFEIDGQGQIEHGEGGDAVAHAEGVDIVVQVLGKGEGQPVSHRADGRAVGGFEHGGLTGALQHLPPVGLISGISRGGEVFGLLRDVGLIAGDIAKVAFPAGKQVQIALADAVAQEHLSPAVGDQVVHFNHQISAAFIYVQ